MCWCASSSARRFGGSENRGVSSVRASPRLHPRPRAFRPHTPRRAGAHVRPSRRVARRRAPRLARRRRSKGQTRRAGRGGPPLLFSNARREPRLDHLRRARAETREDDRVVAPGARHRPTQHGNVHRRVRCVAGCVTRLARPALRSLANRSRRSMASRVPRKRAAAIPPRALLTRSTREPLASSRIAQTPSSARVSRTTPSGRRPACRRRYAATRSRPRRFPRDQRRRR